MFLSDPPAPRWIWLPLPRRQAAEPVVRKWLSEQLHYPAADLRIERTPYGRPELGAPFDHWDCNWSHSGEGLLAALVEGRRVGVDLEWQRPRPRAQMLARRFFSAQEAQWLDQLDPAVREHNFVRLWCAKEAVLKAHGRGLAFGLDRLAFTDTAAGLQLTTCDPALGRPSQWGLRELSPAPGYTAMLAWRDHWRPT